MSLKKFSILIGITTFSLYLSCAAAAPGLLGRHHRHPRQDEGNDEDNEIKPVAAASVQQPASSNSGSRQAIESLLALPGQLGTIIKGAVDESVWVRTTSPEYEDPPELPSHPVVTARTRRPPYQLTPIQLNHTKEWGYNPYVILYEVSTLPPPIVITVPTTPEEPVTEEATEKVTTSEHEDEDEDADAEEESDASLARDGNINVRRNKVTSSKQQ